MRSALAAAAASVVLLAGCGVIGVGSDDEPSSPSTTSSDGAPSEEQGREGDSGDSGDSGAGVADVDLDDVLVEQTVALAGDPEDSVTIGVQSLVVDGPTMTLQLVITPQFASVSDSDVVNLYDVWERDAFRPTLLDRPNLTEYSVIVDDASQEWASDSIATGAVNGSPFGVYATFAAPQDDVATFELRLRDVWPVFTDVPVTR